MVPIGTSSVAERYEAERREQIEEAAKRIADRTDARADTIQKIEEGGIAAANPDDRLSRRLDRLGRYYAGDRLPATPEDAVVSEPDAALTGFRKRRFTREAPSQVLEAAVAVEEDTGKVLEKIINTADFLDIRYLEGGVAASRAVGRIDVRDERDRIVSYGTGSLVSPNLLLTNHHVLPDAGVARLSAVEFNFQDGIDGRPLTPLMFDLDPDTFYVSAKDCDFALVAVRAAPGALDQFGFNPLIEAEGKGVIGENVTIVQHPRGQKKQIALRENQFVCLIDPFVHYKADTEAGSSGSPVFNDQWEIVALHHAGVPAPESPETGGYINEGILVRRIMESIRKQDLSADGKALVEQMIPAQRLVIGAAPAAQPRPQAESVQVAAAGSSITIPLELSIELRIAGASAPVAPEPPAPVEPRPPATMSENGHAASAAIVAERIVIDPSYGDRKGYDRDFLGDGDTRVELPTLSDALMAKAAQDTMATAEPRHVLRYHHYSVVLNKERRLAFFTAVNIDGSLSKRLKRETDRWFLDPRVPAEEQTGEAVYEHNKLDRGHLVRRLDPAWGKTDEEAKSANDDTFHFTNCTPQHEDFNQNKTTWAGLEDYILDNADTRDFKASVFSGPAFADDDEEYRGVKLPRQFWKVVAMVKANGQLSATGYLLSQESLLSDLEAFVPTEDFNYGAYKTFQVPVTQVEALTGLSFGTLSSHDPLTTSPLEAMEVTREVRSHADLVL